MSARSSLRPGPGGCLSFRPHVSEEELQALGLATLEVWDPPCFSSTNNRLVLLDGVPCGALVTQHDHAEAGMPVGQRTGTAPADALEEVVALEILPAFQRRGLARDLICGLARAGRVRVNSPSDALWRILVREGTLTEVECSIFEVCLSAARAGSGGRPVNLFCSNSTQN